MDMLLYGTIFIVSAAIFYLSGEWVVRGLMRLSRTLGVREFILAFVVIAAAAVLPELFVGITSALRGVPELALGSVFGNNIAAMTLAVAAGVLFSRRGFIEVGGKTVRTSLLFTAGAAALPALLIYDGVLSRVDGVILLLFFCIYVRWLFTKQDRFHKEYKTEHSHGKIYTRMRESIGDVLKVSGGIILLLLAAWGVVASATFFAFHFAVPIILIGLFVTGLGAALPEVYFSITSSRKGRSELIMGGIIGAVMFSATLVLGIVALLHPIHTNGLEAVTASRIFLLATAALFFVFALTRHRVGRMEAVLLVALYAAFIVMATTWAII